MAKKVTNSLLFWLGRDKTPEAGDVEEVEPAVYLHTPLQKRRNSYEYRRGSSPKPRIVTFDEKKTTTTNDETEVVEDVKKKLGLEKEIERLKNENQALKGKLHMKNMTVTQYKTSLELNTKASSEQVRELTEEVEELKKRILAMNQRNFIIDEDRTILREQVYEEREKRMNVEQKLELLLKEKLELDNTLELLNIEMAKMAKLQHDSRRFAQESRSVNDEVADSEFREKFHLPSTEFPVAHYYCTLSSNLQGGWLYVTPAYLCYENIMWNPEGTRITVKLRDILAITHIRKFQYVPGTDNGLMIELRSGKQIEFYSFVDRGFVVKEILRQTDKYNYLIKINDGK